MKIGTILVGLAATTALTAPAHAVDVEVIHWWTSGGEQAAISVFADAFEASGPDRWIDTGIAGGDNARTATLQRILGGDPPEAAHFNISRQFEELVEAGMLLDLTEVAERDGWRNVIRPAEVLEVCEHEGRIYCVPVNIHSWQWAWASIPVFEQSGVDLPQDIFEFLDAAPQIAEAGFIPFAMGGESWQRSGAFGVLLLNILGRDGYERLYRDKDVEFAGSAEVREVIEVFRSLKEWSDPGSENRNWNDTTNLVITDRAGLQIMGDWARGEFALAEEEPGVDYACIPGPSANPYLSIGGDVFLFPLQDDPEVEAAQLRLAALMVDPAVQTEFNLVKGSLPVRADVDLTRADHCMTRGLELLDNPDTVVADPIVYTTPDTDGQLRDLFAEIWSNDDLTIEDAQATLVNIIATAE